MSGILGPMLRAHRRSRPRNTILLVRDTFAYPFDPIERNVRGTPAHWDGKSSSALSAWLDRYESSFHDVVSHVVLTEIVARRLNDILPADALRTRMSRVHNPVRAEDTEENRRLLADVVFEVPISEIIEEARGIAPEFGHGISPGL